MFARELQQAVSEKNQTIDDRDQARAERAQAIEEKERLKIELDGKDREIARFSEQTQGLEKQVDDYKMRYHNEQDKITQKQQELDKIKEDVPSAKKITELENQFSIHRENIRLAYDELLKTLTALSRTDPEKKEMNREAAHEMLQNMANMLKEWPPAIKTNLKINLSN